MSGLSLKDKDQVWLLTEVAVGRGAFAESLYVLFYLHPLTLLLGPRGPGILFIITQGLSGKAGI